MIRPTGRTGAPGPAVLLVLLLTGCGAGGDGAKTEPFRPVRSLLEIRQEGVVMQSWDLSCGAAALATLLNFEHGDPVTEREVALGLIDREAYLEEPDLVRVRDGFSLLDLKRYVDHRGYEGIGLGRLTLEDLQEQAPIIVPVWLTGVPHFVVVRGVHGGRVLMADPLFGNRTLPVDAFERSWAPYPDLGRVGFKVERPGGLPIPSRLAPTPIDFVTLG